MGVAIAHCTDGIDIWGWAALVLVPIHRLAYTRMSQYASQVLLPLWLILDIVTIQALVADSPELLAALFINLLRPKSI